MDLFDEPRCLVGDECSQAVPVERDRPVGEFDDCVGEAARGFVHWEGRNAQEAVAARKLSDADGEALARPAPRCERGDAGTREWNADEKRTVGATSVEWVRQPNRVLPTLVDAAHKTPDRRRSAKPTVGLG